MTAKEIRKKYLEFLQTRGHAIIPSASLLPDNDSSSLFIGSGMQPLIPYLSGEDHPDGLRLTDSQKCFRAGDIEEVGDNRHNTFFEMLGNWSLGDYFKKEQLSWLFEFLTEILKLDPNRLYVSVYSGNKDINIQKDEEAVKIWQDLFKTKKIRAEVIDSAEKEGMKNGRIFYYGDDKNWWSRSGAPQNMPVGELGGPDSEVFYDLGADLKKHENSKWKDEPCHINCDCGRFIEIGNSVFMEFIKTKQGFKPLPKKNVDFGGGLERLAMATQGKDNIFETDLFSDILNKISELSGGKKYRENMKAFEIIADHLKAAVFIIGDDRGITPANTDQGYIVRRLIRRAMRYSRQLDIKSKNWLEEIAIIIKDIYKDIYPELNKNFDFIIKQLNKEQEKFEKTLRRGEIMIKGENINGEYAFNLFQTYGYPIEMTKEIAIERNIKLSVNFDDEFRQAMKKHQNLSRTASAGKFKGGLADHGEETTKLHTAAHLLLAALRKVLKDDVYQKGSNITAERLRFDFSHDGKLTDEEKKKVEDLVNKIIAADLPVQQEEMDLEEAKRQGATGVFDSKYGKKVKVYTIGKNDDIFSKEICGGPHVEKTGILGHFKIKKEQSSSAGVRRIKAILS